MSQAGMVAHWRREGGRPARHSLFINGAGAAATGATLLIVVVSKFTEGAWLTTLFIPLVFVILHGTHRHYSRIARETRAHGPVVFRSSQPPVVLVAVRSLDRVTRKALGFATTISTEIRAVQVRLSDPPVDDLSRSWPELVEQPARAAGVAIPKLVILCSAYRQLLDPFLGYVRRVAREEPHRIVAVLVPELVERRWYHFLLHSHTATALQMMLLFQSGPQIVIINTPWYVRERRVPGVRRASAARTVPRPASSSFAG